MHKPTVANCKNRFMRHLKFLQTLIITAVLYFNIHAQFAFVPNLFDNTVSVIDTEGNKVIQTLDVGTFPSSVAWLPDCSKIYVGSTLSNGIDVFDFNGSIFSRSGFILSEGVSDLKVSSNGAQLWVADGKNGVIRIYNTNNNSEEIGSPITVGVDLVFLVAPTAISLTPDGVKAIVTYPEEGSIIFIDVNTKSILHRYIQSEGKMNVGELSKLGTHYASLGGANKDSLYIFDVNTRSLLNTLFLEDEHNQLTWSNDDSKLYVISTNSNHISIINTNVVSNVFKDTGGNISLSGLGPSGIDITSSDNYLYVTMEGNDQVTIVDIANKTELTSTSPIIPIPVGDRPLDIFIKSQIDVLPPTAPLSCEDFATACYDHLGNGTRDCSIRYTASCGNFKIPLSFHYNDDISPNPSQASLEDLLEKTNMIFVNNNVPIEVYLYDYQNDLNINQQTQNECIGFTNEEVFKSFSERYLDIFLIQRIQRCLEFRVGGRSSFPWDTDRGIRITTELKNGNESGLTPIVLAHEIGHYLGLYHTYHEDSQLQNLQCNSCASHLPFGDGISQTCFDPDSGETSKSQNNLLDRCDADFDFSNQFIDRSLESCQVSKMLDVLNECKNRFCEDRVEMYLSDSNYILKKCESDPNPTFRAVHGCFNWYNYSGDPNNPRSGNAIATGSSFTPQGNVSPGDHKFFMADAGFGYNNSCGFILTLRVKEIGSNFCTGNFSFNDPDDDFDLEDPCSCSNPLNVVNPDGSVKLFHDILTISNAPANQSITISNDINFLDRNGNPINGIVGNTDINGSYMLEFYHPVGIASTLDVSINAITKPFVSSVCFQCVNVPTLSEWGLISLSIMLLIIGIVAYRSSDYSQFKNI